MIATLPVINHTKTATVDLSKYTLPHKFNTITFDWVEIISKHENRGEFCYIGADKYGSLFWYNNDGIPSDKDRENGALCIEGELRERHQVPFNVWELPDGSVEIHGKEYRHPSPDARIIYSETLVELEFNWHLSRSLMYKKGE
jgi:hypothetical protein